MASLTLTVPDAQVDDIAFALGWETGDGSKGAYIKTALVEYVRQNYQRYKTEQDVDAVRIAGLTNHTVNIT